MSKELLRQLKRMYRGNGQGVPDVFGRRKASSKEIFEIVFGDDDLPQEEAAGESAPSQAEGIKGKKRKRR